jgi:hypothetical protein
MDASYAGKPANVTSPPPTWKLPMSRIASGASAANPVAKKRQAKNITVRIYLTDLICKTLPAYYFSLT